MESVQEVNSIKLYSRGISGYNGALKFYDDGDIKLFLGETIICSRFAYHTDIDFDKSLFKKLHTNFVINTQFEGELDDELHSFYYKYTR